MSLVVLSCIATWVIMAMMAFVAVVVLKVVNHFSKGGDECPGCPAGIGVENRAVCDFCTDARKTGDDSRG